MKISITTLVTAIASTAVAAPAKRVPGFIWFGAAESGAEWGSNIPGTLGVDYIWPNTSAVQILLDQGLNIFRIPFLMERLVPTNMTGPFDQAYLSDLASTVEYITTHGGYALIDPHNYGRYYGNIINSTSDFQTFWYNVASQFATNTKVMFDTNNEYNTMPQSLVFGLNQAAIDGIRAAGATEQYIFAEGNQWTGAWDWTTYNSDLVNLTDPSNMLVYEMHQYFNSDYSSSDTCQNSTIGQDVLVGATNWLRENGKKGFIGEYEGGPNSVCEEAVQGMLTYMYENSDVWVGATWWAAGPWWGTIVCNLEPPSGTAYLTYMPLLKQFVPGSIPSLPTVTATTTATPTITSTPTATSTGASEWGQCGGEGWTGPTTCQSPYTCQVQNSWYSQCL